MNDTIDGKVDETSQIPAFRSALDDESVFPPSFSHVATASSLSLISSLFITVRFHPARCRQEAGKTSLPARRPAAVSMGVISKIFLNNHLNVHHSNSNFMW